jgi:hypothetical protein
MTVSELMKELEKLPPEMDVVVQSYEEGFDPVTDLKQIGVTKRDDKPWYCGIYEETNTANRPVVLIHSRFNRQETEKA